MRKELVAISSLALAGCPGAKTPSASKQLSVEVGLTVERDGQRIHVGEGEVVRSCEVVELAITPSEQSFLYVVMQNPDGGLDLLAPETQDDVLFSAGETVYVPSRQAGYEYYFDDTTGLDKIVVMATLRPIKEADQDAFDLLTEARAIVDDPNAPDPCANGGRPSAVVDAGMPVVAVADAERLIDAAPIDAAPVPEETKVVTVKRKATKPRKHSAAGGGGGNVNGGSIGLQPRGIRKRVKRDRGPQLPTYEADEQGVAIITYVVDHQP